MTSKQRAYLKSLANNIDPIFQVGKSSLAPELTEAIGAKKGEFRIKAFIWESFFLSLRYNVVIKPPGWMDGKY